jgi:hypothetical protein
MKGLIFRYFSLLLLFLVIGVNLFGSEGSKGNIPVSDKENIEKASEEFQVSTTPFDQHGVFERTLEFSSRQIVNNGSREQFSLSFYRKTELASRRSEFRMMEEKTGIFPICWDFDIFKVSTCSICVKSLFSYS